MSKNDVKIYTVANRILKVIETQLEYSSGRAILAKLRNSIGRPLSYTIEIWPIILEYVPDEYLNEYAVLTDEEDAILSTLQLYALYQQGMSQSVLPQSDADKYFRNFGYSLSFLRQSDDSTAIDRRFNTLITSSNDDEFKYHLRQMTSLLKTKSKDLVPVDFAKLCEDLYWFKRGYRESIRLSWSKSYYSQRKGADSNENK